jgi:hypothetical protein
MDPITTTIVAALAGGAAVAAKDVATSAVKDAYAGLKHLIVDRYKRAGAITVLEEDPASETGKKALEEALMKSGAAADPEVQQGAAALGQALQDLPPQARAGLEVQLKDIAAGQHILLERLASSGGVKVDVQGARAAGDFALRDVTAGVEPKNR